jgi:hypothetical protein
MADLAWAIPVLIWGNKAGTLYKPAFAGFFYRKGAGVRKGIWVGAFRMQGFSVIY